MPTAPTRNPVRRPRVVVADDHPPMLEQLTRLLAQDYDVVATAADGQAALEAARQAVPDLLVLDIAMPRMNGLAVAAQVRAGDPGVKVVFVTMHYDREFVQEALSLGPVGFVAKDRLVLDLLPAIRAVQAGERFISPTITR